VNERKTDFGHLYKNTLLEGKKKKVKTLKSSLTYKFWWKWGNNVLATVRNYSYRTQI